MQFLCSATSAIIFNVLENINIIYKNLISAAPPPTYESVIGRVREVHKESSGTLDFIKKIILLLAGTGNNFFLL